MIPTRILLDMDEVLVDFTGGMLAVHGRTREEVEKVRTPGVWSLAEPMGLTIEEFWRPINAAGEAFWTKLEPLPWTDLLTPLVCSLVVECYVVTIPGLNPYGFSGKVKWLRRYYGEHFVNFVMTYDKTLLARPDTLLIDDREETVERFVHAGGRGILFPSRGNSLYAMASDPIPYLHSQLEKEFCNAPQVS